MVINDYGKLIILALGMAGAIAMLMTHTLDDAAGVGIITGILGYVTGNGRLAITGERQSPMITSSDSRD